MIDWARVLVLREEVGAKDFAEVVDLFLDEVQEALLRLQGPMTADQFEAELHFLKGSALNLGFAAFADLCEAEERQASAGQNPAGCIPALRSCYARSRAVFLKELPQKLAPTAA
ncbi:Hpt domain-containing protein [Sulfitobacter sp. PS-8MA]|uniref:Hpt domain-containing protein n=1 Tax=Sulfitobacter sp. PS-8MA TaxID=3237707 RepID=UPI0034C68E0C